MIMVHAIPNGDEFGARLLSSIMLFEDSVRALSLSLSKRSSFICATIQIISIHSSSFFLFRMQSDYGLY